MFIILAYNNTTRMTLVALGLLHAEGRTDRSEWAGKVKVKVLPITGHEGPDGE